MRSPAMIRSRSAAQSTAQLLDSLGAQPQVGQGRQLHVLPGVGHLSPSEDPDTVNQLIRTFLNRTPEVTP